VLFISPTRIPEPKLMIPDPVEDPAVQGGCLSCAIAAGESPAHVVYETVRFVAFLDSAPIRPGHLRIVPRDHCPHFNALPPSLANELLNLGQRLAEAQRSAFAVERVGFLFPAGGAPHAQVEVVPLLSAGDVMARRHGATNGGGACEADLARAARLLRQALAATEAAPSGHGSNTPGAPCELLTI
jgi:histidine triad (HIT) family protein